MYASTEGARQHLTVVDGEDETKPQPWRVAAEAAERDGGHKPRTAGAIAELTRQSSGHRGQKPASRW